MTTMDSEQNDSIKVSGPYAGKLIILFIFVLSIAATIFAVWFRNQQGDQCLEFWGSDSSMLIRFSKQAELLRLEEGTAGDKNVQILEIANQSMVVLEVQDVSHIDHLVDIRKGLTYDAGFAWDGVRGDCLPQWKYALRFIDQKKNQQTTVVFDFACRRVLHLKSGREASIAPISKGIEKILAEKMDAQIVPSEQ